MYTPALLLQYEVVDQQSALLAQLQNSWPDAAELRYGELSTQCLDSFDWRLYQQGQTLELEVAGDDTRLIWNDPEHAAVTIRPQRLPPRMAGDIDDHNLAVLVGKVVEQRALLAHAALDICRRCLVLYRGRTLLGEIWLDQPSVRGPAEVPERPLATRLRVLPTADGVEPLRAWLEPQLLGGAARAASEPLVGAAVRALGRQPRDYSNKPPRCREPYLRADRAIKVILRSLTATMVANESGVRGNWDSEFLHDYRVALRRTRTLLRQFKTVFVATDLARYQTGFAWLANLTSTPRDLDVLLAQLEDYAAGLPATTAPDIAELRAYWQAERDVAGGVLVAAIDSVQYAEFFTDWCAFLERPVPSATDSATAMLPIFLPARRRIYALFRRARREGRDIEQAGTPMQLHALRKTCKKLRYLMEFFSGLFPVNEVKPLLRTLKLLQDNLGSFQDAAVHLEAIQRYLHVAPIARVLAARLLMDELYRRQTMARRSFDGCFAQFAAVENRRRYRKLFCPGTA